MSWLAREKESSGCHPASMISYTSNREPGFVVREQPKEPLFYEIFPYRIIFFFQVQPIWIKSDCLFEMEFAPLFVTRTSCSMLQRPSGEIIDGSTVKTMFS